MQITTNCQNALSIEHCDILACGTWSDKCSMELPSHPIRQRIWWDSFKVLWWCPTASMSSSKFVLEWPADCRWWRQRSMTDKKNLHWFEGRHVPHHINHSLGCRVVTRVLTSPSFCPPQINYLIIICGTFNDWCGDLTFDMTEIWLMLLTKSDKFMCCGRPGGTLLLAPGAPRSNDLVITSKIRDSSQLQIT